ncbi:NAD(P)H-hydrate epimerase [Sunxiuqinia sp. A32]|uniref:NAD(P)H-hydrate epimerase n=1 Tax=Sunxiuqinia sp. A32 TaxID=3461496 RepID=UPI00404523D1
MRSVPYITTQQMIEVDKLMMEYYRIGLLQMMEMAGFNLATLAKRRFNLKDDDNILVLAGTGGNGGGVLVAARHLSNWGMDVSVQLSNSIDHFKQVSLHQLDILEKMNVPIIENTNGRNFHLIIDGLIGYSLRGNPRERVSRMIVEANENLAPVLSLDVPSGMDSTSGKINNPCIVAEATMTLALPKSGFLNKKSKPNVGELYLSDISVPPELYQRMGLIEAAFPIFSEENIIQLF